MLKFYYHYCIYYYFYFLLIKYSISNAIIIKLGKIVNIIYNILYECIIVIIIIIQNHIAPYLSIITT